ncbi:WecB/TagA/CpsF family glycosyltransferase [Aerococcus urinae]
MEVRILSHKRIQILNTNIDVLNTKETIELVDKYIQNHKPLHLMGVNADKINQLNKNPELKRIVNECEVINADGASVVLASKYLGKELPERVAGIDLMQDLLKLAEDRGYSIYLIGAKEQVIQDTVAVIKHRYPKLEITGYRNGYFDKSQWKSIGKDISNKNPQIVFVGITSPLKEYLVDYWLKKGFSSVYMGVGGSFDVISGNIPRAPKWMQNHNLEWLFRVSQEPKRLFKRYFVGNSQFIHAIIKEKRGK